MIAAVYYFHFPQVYCLLCKCLSAIIDALENVCSLSTHDRNKISLIPLSFSECHRQLGRIIRILVHAGSGTYDLLVFLVRMPSLPHAGKRPLN